MALLAGIAPACGVSVTVGAGDHIQAVPPGHFPSAAEINRLPDAPGTFAVARLPSSYVTNPDPRGPCGAPISQPDFTKGNPAVYTSPARVELFMWSRRLPQGAAERYVNAMQADIRPGCADFTSRTPYRYDQVNEFLHPIPLPMLGDDRVAVAVRVRQNHQVEPWTYAIEALVRRGDSMTAIVMFSAAPQKDGFVRELTALVAGDGA